ncbi:MAG: hypothetical protein IPH11_14975 [Ignavibacteriales bacterium]|nr:hypothetical protein [Ignavibacteriales bacterium]
MKNVLMTLTIFLIAQQIASAQQLTSSQLDSIFNTMIKLHNPVASESPLSDSLSYPENKCGFGLVNSIKENLNLFTAEQQRTLKVLLDRPLKSDSLITPGGFFIIHYNASGADAPTYDVNELAAALDSSYNFEINYLGYPPPPDDNNAGGDNHYDVYISDISAYGFTTFEFTGNANTGPSFITIDDDFGSGFFTHGIEAAKVTAAHEFHHSIQAGNYIFRIEDLFFYELTSTSMEEFVYDDVNDYYGYMKNYFDNTFVSLANQNGYNLAIWNVFLQNNFGFDIIKRQWELMPSKRAIDAINTSIEEEGQSFPFALNQFGIWTYFTDYRTSEGRFFEEAENYPLIKPLTTTVFSPPSKEVDINSKPTANNFIRFVNSADSDTLTALLTNGDYINGINNTNGNFPFQYILFNDSSSGSRALTENYSADFIVSNEAVWSGAEILNNQIIGVDSISPNGNNIDYAFPNPFKYDQIANSVYIPVPSGTLLEVDLNIYSISMNLIYNSSGLRIINKDIIDEIGNKVYKRVVQWDGLDNDGNRLPTGIYIYVTKMNDEIVKGKLVIFNE